jgi:hypothetical protein
MSHHYHKYPRTPHLPWSPGASSDDVRLADTSVFVGQEIIVTEKLDGENTSMYSDHIHARSLDSRHHPSRNWVKALHGTLAHLIPPGWRLCGENLYARHSIAYDNLPSYFALFSIWDEANRCLAWDETLDWAALLGLEVVPTLYRGPWDEQHLRNLAINTDVSEGYVVRTTAAFAYPDFARHVAKWVRPSHVQTDQHWMHTTITPNRLRPDSDVPA